MVIHFIKRIIRNSQSNFTAKVSIALGLALLLNLFFGVLFYFAERNAQDGLTLIDSIWWAMVTMTTVGYGDYFPQTFVGRFFVGYPCFIIGIGLIGYLLGMLAESMIDLTAKKRKGQLKLRMKDHIIICHCPSEKKVLNIAQELRATAEHKNVALCVISENLEELPAEFQKNNIAFVKGDPTDEAILRKASITQCQGVIVLAKKPGDTSSDSSTFTIGTVVEMISDEIGKNINTVAEVLDTTNDKLFARSKVDGAVIVEGFTDKMLAQEFLHPGIHSTFEQLLTNTSGSQFYNCPTNLTGESFVDIQSAALKHRLNLQVVGLIRNDNQLLNPPKTINIEANDMLLVLAESKNEFATFEQDYKTA